MPHLPEPIVARLCGLAPASFPKTIEKVDRLIGNGLAPTPVIISVIASDPLFTAAVLGQAAISGAEVSQLSQAVLHLGLSMVQGLSRSLVAIPESRAGLMGGYWAEANACAAMTRVVVGYRPTMFMGSVDEETAHTCGLLHNLGTIVAALRFPNAFDHATNRLAGGEGPLSTLIGAELGCDPALMTERLAGMWGLPQVVTIAATHHRRAVRAPQFPHLCAAIHVARTLIRGCGYCPELDPYVETLDEEAIKLLDLSLTDVPRLLDRFFLEMEESEIYEPTITVGM